MVRLSNIASLTNVGAHNLPDHSGIVKSPTRSTQRARFLTQIDLVMPWNELLHIMETQPRAKAEDTRTAWWQLLRIYFMQRWFRLDDEEIQDALGDSICMLRFAGITPGDRVPDSVTLQKFRTYLKRSQLASTLSALAHCGLHEHRLAVRRGSILEPALLIAPAHDQAKRK